MKKHKWSKVGALKVCTPPQKQRPWLKDRYGLLTHWGRSFILNQTSFQFRRFHKRGNRDQTDKWTIHKTQTQAAQEQRTERDKSKDRKMKLWWTYTTKKIATVWPLKSKKRGCDWNVLVYEVSPNWIKSECPTFMEVTVKPLGRI